MKPRYMGWMLVCTAGLIAFLSGGCYTQFGSTRDEGVVRYENEEDEYAYDDSVATTENYDNARERFYDDSYYPGYGFGVGFYDPWAWHYRPGYGYGSYWYDPYWGWCGTSYPYYSAWWSRPVFGYRPFSYYGPVHRGGSGYMTKSGSAHGASRSFGSTRSSGGIRGVSGYTPGGTRSGSYGTAPSAGTYQTKPRTSTTHTARTAERPARVASPSGTHQGARSNATRSYPRPSNAGHVARTYSPPPSSSGNGGGNSSGRNANRGERSGGTYTPAPSSPPPSSPPSSRGSNAPANTGDRGGNRR